MGLEDDGDEDDEAMVRGVIQTLRALARARSEWDHNMHTEPEASVWSQEEHRPKRFEFEFECGSTRNAAMLLRADWPTPSLSFVLVLVGIFGEPRLSAGGVV